jgi:predicted NBD/HSP70 family sugar kinase
MTRAYVPLSSRPADGGTTREANLATVLSTVIRHAPIARARLVDYTGLTKATITSLADELIADGWIRTDGHVQQGVGRPSQMLVPDGARGLLGALEINVDYLAVLLCDFSCEQLHLERSWVEVAALGPEGAVAQLAEMLERALTAIDEPPEQLLGISLAVPGIVDEQGILGYAANLGWNQGDLGAMLAPKLQQRLELTITVSPENEANLAAVCEQVFGQCAEIEHFVYVSAELGVGAGVVSGSELFRGRRGAGGEVGHLTIDPDGPPCQCGKRGCWQTYVAQGSHGAGLEGDSERLLELVALGIGNIVQTYDPELVILGGWLAPIAESHHDELMAHIARWTMGGLERGVRVSASTKGQDSAIWGAVGVVLSRAVARPRSLRAAVAAEVVSQ